ncbi:O-antigen ligase family protein [Allosphingosinicella sp.]|uniref:O-antigen ligase family protein n=1 Tax=Allosphingosinicella sp. TaxID=2823234 RepID=UPI003D75CF73
MVQIGALALLWHIASIEHRLRRPRHAALPIALLFLMLAVPLVQLVPLPAPVWSALPARETARAVYAQIGLADAWRPLSLHPAGTVHAALALLPGIALFFATLFLPTRVRRYLIFALLSVALVSALIGLLQKSGLFALYGAAARDSASGLFVNRNHQASFLLAAMPLAAAAARGLKGARLAAASLAVMLILVFAGGVVTTMSRFGLLALAPTLLVTILILGPFRWTRPRTAGAILVSALATALALQSSAVRAAAARLGGVAEERLEDWPSVLEAAWSYWPVGSGLGSFRHVYPAAEPFANLSPAELNNAHNDYLELVLETGIAAPVLLAGFLGFILLAAAHLTGTKGEERAQGTAALAAILLILLHSAVDYPLRMLSVAALFGFLCGLIVPAAEKRR